MTRPIFSCWPRTESSLELGLCEAFGCATAPTGTYRQRIFCADHLRQIRDLRIPFLTCGAGEGGCCVQCTMTAAASKRILLVGERTPGIDRHEAGGFGAMGAHASGFDLFRVRLIDGAFIAGRSRERLIKSGVRWDDAINLLPQGVGWNADAARDAAIRIGFFARESYDLIVLCGDRVRAAWDADLSELESGGGLLLIPHPSGRSHAWDRSNMPIRVRDAFNAALRGGR